MKRYTLYTLIFFTLLSCGGSKGRFRLKGEFKHLQQGEFYIYSPDGGSNQIDTIKIQNGAFDYSTELESTATYFLLYPNFSEHVVFGKSGDLIKIKGDARSLKETTIEGSAENEAMTQFRLSHQNKSASQIAQEAAKFISKHPDSPVSVYLFKRYFLQAAQSNQKQKQQLYNTLCKAQPENISLAQWKSAVEKANRCRVGQVLPLFKIKEANGNMISSDDYKGQYVLIHFWASWETNSTSVLFDIRRTRRRTQNRLAAISYSLDVNKASLQTMERIDSVSWTSYCDFKAWESPLVEQFHITSIPFCILVDPQQKIIAAGDNFDKDILPKIKEVYQLK